MRFIIPTAVLLPVALAQWNGGLCGGVGGCGAVTSTADGPFRCPDGTRLNCQESSGVYIDNATGNYTVITAAKWPKSCQDGTPAASDVLTVTTTNAGQKFYAWFTPNCVDTEVEEFNCYDKNPNPTSFFFCALFDKKDEPCTQNMNAGQCERWGAQNQPSCAGWEIGKADSNFGSCSI
ncbi:hypothetical protein BU23DRAFT_519149 [Bimuria novae-zelandiae CBS 107.79]|uniref:Secreted protein n=1 Tax=Bimuria novae-zelandiae CBS 107.79 TaxID=1447943 RepID=A0A6A5UPH3_9PLEO|nr:hypothetical protein BU23DRAFT_519149 [Bimuria novae-zelandiae CBS 107.79]